MLRRRSIFAALRLASCVHRSSSTAPGAGTSTPPSGKPLPKNLAGKLGVSRFRGGGSQTPSAMTVHFKDTTVGRRIEDETRGNMLEQAAKAGSRSAKVQNAAWAAFETQTAVRGSSTVGQWAAAVDLRHHWSPTVVKLAPLLFGASAAVTHAIVHEGADVVVLQAPFIPLHLLGSFVVGCWTLHCAEMLTRRMLRSKGWLTPSHAPTPTGIAERRIAASEYAGGEPTGGSNAATLEEVVRMSSQQHRTATGGHSFVPPPSGDEELTDTATDPWDARRYSWHVFGVCVHSTLALSIAANFHWTAFGAAAAILPLSLLAGVAVCRLNEQTRSSFILGQTTRAATRSLGVFVGYAAVVGRFDLGTTVPLWIGATGVIALYESLRTCHDLQLHGYPLPMRAPHLKGVLYGYVLLMIGGMFVSGGCSGQSLVFHMACIALVYRSMRHIDDLNPFDEWSVLAAIQRQARLGAYLFIAMVLGNLVWVMYLCSAPPEAKTTTDAATADGTTTNGQAVEPTKQQQQQAATASAVAIDMTPKLDSPSALLVAHSPAASLSARDILTLRIKPAAGAFNLSASVVPPPETTAAPSSSATTTARPNFTWVDRLVKPVVVYTWLAEQRGEPNPMIPTYMRREFVMENLAGMVRWSGLVDERRVAAAEAWWYGVADHYNIFGKLV